MIFLTEYIISNLIEIVDPFKKMIKEEIMSRLKSFDDFDMLNDIMFDLVREGKLSGYYISKKIEGNRVGVKSVRITSNLDFYHTINFDTIKEDYRNFRINRLLLK